MPHLADPAPETIPDDVRDFPATLPPDPMVKMLSHVEPAKMYGPGGPVSGQPDATDAMP